MGDKNAADGQPENITYCQVAKGLKVCMKKPGSNSNTSWSFATKFCAGPDPGRPRRIEAYDKAIPLTTRRDSALDEETTPHLHT